MPDPIPKDGSSAAIVLLARSETEPIVELRDLRVLCKGADEDEDEYRSRVACSLVTETSCHCRVEVLNLASCRSSVTPQMLDFLATETDWRRPGIGCHRSSDIFFNECVCVAGSLLLRFGYWCVFRMVGGLKGKGKGKGVGVEIAKKGTLPSVGEFW